MNTIHMVSLKAQGQLPNKENELELERQSIKNVDIK